MKEADGKGIRFIESMLGLFGMIMVAVILSGLVSAVSFVCAEQLRVADVFPFAATVCIFLYFIIRPKSNQDKNE